jgi:hypothetical protein
MTRLGTVAASLALLAACTATPPAPDPASRAGAMCVRETQSCDRENRCCAESSCVHMGRYGSLCQRPAPGM